MEPKVKKILVLRNEEVPNLSTVVKMAYCELLPYSQQSGFSKYPEYVSIELSDTVPNGNVAWLDLNRYRLAFFDFVETYRQFRYQWYEIESDNKSDYYIVCCIDNRSEDFIFDYLRHRSDARVEEISFLKNSENKSSEEFKDNQPTDKLEVCELYSRKVVDKLKSLCDISDKPSIETERLSVLTEEAKRYIEDYYSVGEEPQKLSRENALRAYSSFNAEWSKLIYSNTDSEENNLKSTYGKALTVFVQSAELLSKGILSAEIVDWLSAFVFCYEINTQSIGLYSYKQKLYLILSACWHKLGEKFDNESIDTLRWHLLSMFKEEAEYTYPLQKVYGFRKVSTYFLEALIGHTLNITSPFEFNDPFDTPILELYEGRDLGELIKEAFKGTLKISCFTNLLEQSYKCDDQLKDSPMFLDPLMWAHYADSHKGVCLKFRFNAMQFCKDRKLTVAAGFKNIRYSSAKLISCGKSSSISMKDAFFLKGTKWAYENECRFFCFDINGKGSFGQYGDTADYIEAVYFGLRCPKEAKKAIIQILSGSGIKFYQMKIKCQEFGTIEEKELTQSEINTLLM